MSDYGAQLERIRDKLEAARRSDPDFKVFGAKKHKYRLGHPIPEAELTALEQERGCRLTDDLRAFLTTIGNAAPNDPTGKAAGPYYGVNGADILTRGNLDRDPLITPNLSDDAWKRLISAAENEDRHTNETFTDGCAWLVDQGCTYFNLIALRGPHAGRVIYFDESLEKPRFAFETNFLDWYERWLDEVIAGYLSQGSASWFGMTMGGDDTQLLKIFDAADTDRTREDALWGMFKLTGLAPASVRRLADIAGSGGIVGSLALRALVRFAPDAAAPMIGAALEDPETEVRNLAIDIKRSASHLYSENAALFRKRLADETDHMTFSSLIFLMIEGAESAAAYVPFLDHPEPQFRRTAIYAIGASSDREEQIPAIVKALEDDDSGVVLAALQGMKGLNDPRLIATFSDIEERFDGPSGRADGRNYVRINLRHRQRELGLLPPEGNALTRLFRRR